MGSTLNSSCCCTYSYPETPSPTASVQIVRPDPEFARKVEALPNLSRAVATVVEEQKSSRNSQVLIVEPMNLQSGAGGELLDEPYYIIDRLAYYIGEWKNGLPHGQGKMYFDDRCYFEGGFRGGESHCKDGLYVYPDGSYFRGEVVNSAANGYGKLALAQDLMVYTGEWVNDKPEGFGIERFKDGSHYQGYFLAGLKHGKGTFKWADGTRYQGDFVNGLIDGTGKQTLSDGTVITGIFKHGKVLKNTATPDYHQKYVGTVFPIKLPAVDSLDIVRRNSTSSSSQPYMPRALQLSGHSQF